MFPNFLLIHSKLGYVMVLSGFFENRLTLSYRKQRVAETTSYRKHSRTWKYVWCYSWPKNWEFIGTDLIYLLPKNLRLQ